jgi:hypothetical protein
MNCEKCKSKRVASVMAKCSDMCSVTLGGLEAEGYVPRDMGIGGGDYIEFEYCLDCGVIQGCCMLSMTKLEESDADDQE